MSAPDQFRDLIADLMRDYGPDGHTDGSEIIADKAWEWCRAQPDMRWQPIETAPKDGTEVLMFCAFVDEMVTALWSYNNWSLVQCGVYADDSYLFSDPTHWMPLPAPPPA